MEADHEVRVTLTRSQWQDVEEAYLRMRGFGLAPSALEVPCELCGGSALVDEVEVQARCPDCGDGWRPA